MTSWEWNPKSWTEFYRQTNESRSFRSEPQINYKMWLRDCVVERIFGFNLIMLRYCGFYIVQMPFLSSNYEIFTPSPPISWLGPILSAKSASELCTCGLPIIIVSAHTKPYFTDTHLSRERVRERRFFLWSCKQFRWIMIIIYTRKFLPGLFVNSTHELWTCVCMCDIT